MGVQEFLFKTAMAEAVFLPRDATQTTVLPRQVVCCPCVRPSVCNVEISTVSWSYRLEFLENNFTAN